MRVVARVVGAALVLLVLMAAAVALVLPRLTDTAAVRQRLAELAAPALGRTPEFQHFEFRLFPPELLMIDVAPVAASDRSARPERIELTLALPPLLAGVVVIDLAVVEDARLSLVRTPGGVQWAGSSSAQRGSADPMPIALRRLELRNTTIALEDRSVSPSVRWQLENVEATAIAEALDSPVRLEFAGDVVSGGRVTAEGDFNLGGDIDVGLEFESLAIAAAGPYFESNSSLQGALTGSIRVRGTTATPRLELDATLRDARLRLGDIKLRGDLEVEAIVDDAWAAPRGKIELDATQAELSYAQFFTKPPGTAASVVGIIRADKDGAAAIEAWKFVMEDLDGQVRVRFGDRFPLAMGATPAGERPDAARGRGRTGEPETPAGVPKARLRALDG